MKQRLTLHRWLLVMAVAVSGFTFFDALFAQEVSPDTKAQLTETAQPSGNQTSGNQSPPAIQPPMKLQKRKKNSRRYRHWHYPM